MADEEKIDGASSRGADWEVVALSASAYAASPGPDADSQVDLRNKEFHGEHESSSSMYMSEHFVFPPYEHENLPIELDDDDEITFQPGSNILLAEKEHNYSGEFIEDSSEADLSIPNMESEEDQTKCLYAETDYLEMVPSNDGNDVDEAYDSPNQHEDMSPDFIKDGEFRPSEAWWKRRAISLYKQAKETNTVWSLCMAAALMGLVVLGQQWRREKLQFQQLKLQFSINNERMGKLLGSVNRFKDSLVGAHHHSSVIHSSPAANL